VEARVNVDNRSATQHTIVEVVTKDRRDLLYHLSSTIAGCGLNIYLAKINTEGDRVADVFYVSKPDGSRIADPVEIGELQGRLASVIVDLEGAQPADESASDDDSL
jgi:[protein-PII] uridylyltransferase